jgi:CBS domain-containing protein/gamma-glutamyl:cysteine ligase YbdK (ATP-grasp superfamily)
MGEHDVPDELDDRQRRAFVKTLLDDVHALEQMLERGCIEAGVRRIGAEQEMFLVDAAMNPAPVATQVLEHASDPRLTTELARFNLEANLSPKRFGGRCLRELEDELSEVVSLARRAATACGADVLLTGILPTLRKSDLGLENMTPNPRYHALNREISRLRGGEFQIVIKGLDELETTHDNVMLESCNTSFQIHFQVAPAEFARLYNIAQAVTAPVLAAAVNSPVLLGRRLWQETRVALFQRSVDARSSAHQARGLRPRVSFGDAWIRDSVLEIFREDIALFRVVLGAGLDEHSLAEVAAGRVPKLSALRLHNGTVYRWNRACYGMTDGVAHLRIENRALPAGPTIVDEIANAAFFYGLMSGVLETHGDITTQMDFDDAKVNFFAAARHGLDAQLRWFGGQRHTASALILEHLLPLARSGLQASGIDDEDAERYLAIIGERVESAQTGAQWALTSLARMDPSVRPDMKQRTLASAMLEHQKSGEPVHGWAYAKPLHEDDWRRGFQTVAQIMTTDLFTVRPEDLVDLAASMMDWEHIRHVPVEDDDGRLVGLVSHRALLRLVARGLRRVDDEPVAVKEIMRPDPVTVTPATTTLEAMRTMRNEGVGCLPVVEADQKLVGIVTERDLIDVSSRLLEAYLSNERS